MAIIVVGGHSRDVGKTSVVAGLIAALRDFHWTALKITQYGHNVCSANGEPCDCMTADHSLAVTEEHDAASGTDTSRFLAAGAERVFWVRTRQGELATAMPRVRQVLEGATNVIVESNSVMQFIRPDAYLVVLDPSNADFKDSSRLFLDRASAVLMHRASDVAWSGVSLKPVLGRPVFEVSKDNYLPSEAVDFVRAKIASAVQRS